MIRLALCLYLACTAPLYAGDPVVMFSDDDPEMATAVKDALASLDRFLQFADENPDVSLVKVAFPAKGRSGDEIIWVDRFQGSEDFVGHLANHPNDLGDLTLGSQVRFSRTQIRDWGAVIDGQGYGHFTVRATLDRVSEEDAANLRFFLSDDPLPEGWR